MDESGDEPCEIIALKNATATDLVRTITQLNQGGGAAGAEGASSGVKVVADQRTNSMLVSGEKSLRLRIKALIVDLDTAAPGRRRDRGPLPALCRCGEARRETQGPGERVGQGARRGSSLGGAPSPVPGIGGGGTSNVDASVTIWADVPTNALIITAPPKIMKSLMEVIDKLDIRRAQVQVEALIVEVDVNKSSDLGVQWILYGQGNSRRYRPASRTCPESERRRHRRPGRRRRPAAPRPRACELGAIGTGATLAIGRYKASSGTNFAAHRAGDPQRRHAATSFRRRRSSP